MILILIRYVILRPLFLPIYESVLLGVILSQMINSLIKDHKPKHLESESDVSTNVTQIIENQTDEWDTSNLLKHKQYGTMGNLKRSYRKVS